MLRLVTHVTAVSLHCTLLVRFLIFKWVSIKELFNCFVTNNWNNSYDNLDLVYLTLFYFHYINGYTSDFIFQYTVNSFIPILKV